MEVGCEWCPTVAATVSTLVLSFALIYDFPLLSCPVCGRVPLLMCEGRYAQGPLLSCWVRCSPLEWSWLCPPLKLRCVLLLTTSCGVFLALTPAGAVSVCCCEMAEGRID